MKSFIASSFLAMFLALVSMPCLAKSGIVIIASKKSTLSALTAAQGKALFLGEEKFLPGGERVVLVDQAKSAAIKAEFYQAVTGMDVKDASRHWAKIVFTGRGTPPELATGGDQGVMSIVKATPNAIGYVYASSVDGTVKVLLTVNP